MNMKLWSWENFHIDCLDVWRNQMLVPMHYFDIVEVHCPDRVMHQFGLHQHISNDVDTFDGMHVVNHRHKMDDD